MNYWHLQMTRGTLSGKDYSTMQILEIIVNDNIIGTGEWRDSKNDQCKYFKDVIEIGDIVMVRKGKLPIALVKVIGKNISPQKHYDNEHKIEVLSVYDYTIEKILGVYDGQVQSTLTRVANRNNTTGFYIINWHNLATKSNKNWQFVNPELFKGEIPSELVPNSYYAYIDNIEELNENIFIRFDCIEKELADELNINKETILNFPSIIIEISGSVHQIKSKLKNSNFDDIESSWCVIKTTTNQTELNLESYFNFTRVGEGNISNNLENITQYDDLDEASQAKINEIVKATTLSESSEKEVYQFLNEMNLSTGLFVNVYNVGQGNCNALVEMNMPLLYFDVGGGIGANKKTYPVNFKLCTTLQPKVILSHWDMDHITSAVYDSQLLNLKWLAPTHTSISATAFHIAQNLINRNNLICWNNNLPKNLNFNTHCIVKCGGNPNSKNNSGLALFVNYGNDEFILLPGDASFNEIPQASDKKLIGLVASHHGAKGSITGMPFANPPAMLVYSFGYENKYQHAHTEARNAYLNNGWRDYRETLNGNIAISNNLGNLSTPCNNANCTLSIIQIF